MVRLLVCCESDIPSVNMKDSLMSKRRWEDAGTSERCRFVISEDTAMMITPDLHIRFDDVDHRAKDVGLDIDEVVFMSRHSAASGEAALTVHPIGNYNENKYGGKEETLVPSAPSSMTDALRRIATCNRLPEFKVCFEVTHHGPWLERPTFFIEIGSDERNWENLDAADLLTNVLLDIEPQDNPRVVGVGGGHYAPRFTEVALNYKVDFGHMLPNYQLEGKGDEDIIRMIGSACEATDTKQVYLHRKSMKKQEERHISDLIISSGFEQISSSDLEPINGN